ncbi:MAG: hypothetical protein ACP5H3_01085 [Candidatus Aenigmatarchaeota archaeon]|jgi:hypothetical protein
MPVEPTEREIYREVLEEGEMLFDTSLKPLGDYYHEILRSYGKDRGFSAFQHNLSYFYETFSHVKDILTKNMLYFPCDRKLIDIYRRLERGLEELEKILEERVENQVLMPEEFVEVAYTLGNVRIFMDFLYGLMDLRKEILVNEKSVREIINKEKNILFAFLRKIYERNNQYDTFHMGKEEDYSFLVFFGIDAEDNSLLRNLLRQEGNRKEQENLLKSYIPEKGLNEVLFNKEEEVKRRFREALRFRNEREKMCLPRNFTLRINPQKFKNYLYELFPERPSYVL